MDAVGFRIPRKSGHEQRKAFRRPLLVLAKTVVGFRRLLDHGVLRIRPLVAISLVCLLGRTRRLNPLFDLIRSPFAGLALLRPARRSAVFRIALDLARCRALSTRNGIPLNGRRLFPGGFSFIASSVVV